MVVALVVMIVLAVDAADRVRIGLYTDSGSRGGANASWAEFLGGADADFRFLSGRDLREGALKDLDLLVVPGGTGYGQYESMKEAGAKAIRDFIRDGGCYYGTCAGIALLLNEDKRVKLLPFQRIAGHYLRGGGELEVEFDAASVQDLKLPKNRWKLRFHNGPILAPGKAVEGVSATVLAKCLNAIDENKSSPKRRDDMIGTAAFVYAEYGKGRIFACNCHPESNADTRELIRCGFTKLLGREVKLPDLSVPHVIPCGKARMVIDLEGYVLRDGRKLERREIFLAPALTGGKNDPAINDRNRNFIDKALRFKTLLKASEATPGRILEILRDKSRLPIAVVGFDTDSIDDVLQSLGVIPSPPLTDTNRTNLR